MIETRDRRDLLSDLRDWRRFDLGPRRIVTVADPDIVNALLRDRPDGFRRWSEIESITEEIWGSPGVFSAEGEDWRRSRRPAVTALNSNQLQRYFEIIATSTERRLEEAARDGRPIEIGEALSAFTVDVTCAAASSTAPRPQPRSSSYSSPRRSRSSSSLCQTTNLPRSVVCR